MSSSLSDIETSARKLREARDQVAEIVAALDREITALQADAARRIKSAVNKTADRHAELTNLIDTNRHLFEKPRTHTFHGVTCGISKGKGSIEFDDEEQVIKNI